MPQLKLALVQLDPKEIPSDPNLHPGDIAKKYAEVNFPKVKQYLKQIEEKDTDLIVFPELIPGGFSTAKELSPEVRYLQEWSKKNDKYVIANETLVLKPGEEIYNTMVFISSDGTIDRYTKRNLFISELETSKPGKEPKIFDVKEVKIYPLICNDLLSSGFTEEAKKMNADVIIYQSAAVACAVTPGTRKTKAREKFSPEGLAYLEQYPRFKKIYKQDWETMLIQDSNEHNIPIVMCNLAGEHWPPNSVGGGHSMVILPGKGVVKQLGEEEGILYYNLEL